MAGGEHSITWSNPIPDNLDTLDRDLDARIRVLMEYFADRSESFAKQNAPWQDQTGNARQGLSADARAEGSRNVTYTLTVYHTMPYGLWLEVRWSGRYAIIMPTINHHGSQIMNALKSLMNKAG